MAEPIIRKKEGGHFLQVCPEGDPNGFFHCTTEKMGDLCCQENPCFCVQLVEVNVLGELK